MPQRQNTVDMIGELPDIDFFSIPGARLLAAHCSALCANVLVWFTCVFWDLTVGMLLTVDDFYDDYVTELGTRNSRKLSGKSNPFQHKQTNCPGSRNLLHDFFGNDFFGSAAYCTIQLQAKCFPLNRCLILQEVCQAFPMQIILSHTALLAQPQWRWRQAQLSTSRHCSNKSPFQAAVSIQGLLSLLVSLECLYSSSTNQPALLA